MWHRSCYNSIYQLLVGLLSTVSTLSLTAFSISLKKLSIFLQDALLILLCNSVFYVQIGWRCKTTDLGQIFWTILDLISKCNYFKVEFRMLCLGVRVKTQEIRRKYLYMVCSTSSVVSSISCLSSSIRNWGN